MPEATKGGVMAVMQSVGRGRRPPLNARLEAREAQYSIELDVAAFARSELSVEVLGAEVTVHGEQHETAEEDGRPFRLRERFDESFRLPDDALADGIVVFYGRGSLELRVPR